MLGETNGRWRDGGIDTAGEQPDGVAPADAPCVSRTPAHLGQTRILVDSDGYTLHHHGVRTNAAAETRTAR